jgi:hypothetical protein
LTGGRGNYPAEGEVDDQTISAVSKTTTPSTKGDKAMIDRLVNIDYKMLSRF